MLQTKPQTRFDYGHRVERVMAYIADHLDEDLSLDKLAEIACFSPYHFHRIYRSIAGETVADTVRRLRLHRAAGELARSAYPIERIARRAGYGSVEAFTRAFGSGHGEPPGAFRARFTPFQPFGTGDDIMIPVKVRQFDGVHLATVAHRGDYHEIGKAFDKLGVWAATRGLFDRPRRMIGIYYDDPESVPQAQLRSEAGLEVDPAMSLDDGIVLRHIPAGRVATIVHKGPYTGLEEVYRQLYCGWLPGSGEEASDQPAFEQYLNNPRDTPPSELLTEVNLPLRG
ncbi:AraC family transcriptional regulator [Microvirga terricola]|uniref:AraC family transcriptional regulator n=1 Tax=Microvirga terricola TaxID=2719797 RepID=A0ABX0V923_9HYPH|nr:AraC family transcriptional regulator [Microvirga terricola]NIX76319.1 AraC family transcriptional regulator [Microvirga terricola]